MGTGSYRYLRGMKLPYTDYELVQSDPFTVHNLSVGGRKAMRNMFDL